MRIMFSKNGDFKGTVVFSHHALQGFHLAGFRVSEAGKRLFTRHGRGAWYTEVLKTPRLGNQIPSSTSQLSSRLSTILNLSVTSHWSNPL
jgi:hypothetical protein